MAGSLPLPCINIHTGHCLMTPFSVGMWSRKRNRGNQKIIYCNRNIPPFEASSEKKNKKRHFFFSSGGFLIPDNCSFCQVDKKLASTLTNPVSSFLLFLRVCILSSYLHVVQRRISIICREIKYGYFHTLKTQLLSTTLITSKLLVQNSQLIIFVLLIFSFS